MVFWLRQWTHNLVVVGSNPGTVYWMDVSDSSFYNWKITKIKIAKWGEEGGNVDNSCSDNLFLFSLILFLIKFILNYPRKTFLNLI
jgi:hypothetical protein